MCSCRCCASQTADITHDNPGVPYGKPLVITTIHRLQFTSSMAPVRELQSRVYSPLHPILAALTTSVAEYASTHLTSASAITSLSPLVDISHLHRSALLLSNSHPPLATRWLLSLSHPALCVRYAQVERHHPG